MGTTYNADHPPEDEPAHSRLTGTNQEQTLQERNRQTGVSGIVKRVYYLGIFWDGVRENAERRRVSRTTFRRSHLPRAQEPVAATATMKR